MRTRYVPIARAAALVLGLISVVMPESAQAQSAVDGARFEVQCPESGYRADEATAAAAARLRSVRVTLNTQGLDYQQASVKMDLLRAAAQAVWSQCPITLPLSGTTFTTEAHSIGSAEIYGTPEAGSQLTLLLRATSYASYCICWEHVEDVYAQHQQVVAEQAAQRAAQEQAATIAQQQAAQAAVQYQISQQQAVAQANQQAQQAAANAANSEAWDMWWANLWRTIKLIFWLGVSGLVAVWIIRRRNAIARWYYFTFHPHPAADLVAAAIGSHAPLDGSALARALGELPPGNSIFRGVRLEQAEQLFRRMQKVSEARIREQRERAREGYERAALDSIQEAVALAAIALERAKALYRASQTVGGSV